MHSNAFTATDSIRVEILRLRLQLEETKTVNRQMREEIKSLRTRLLIKDMAIDLALRK